MAIKRRIKHIADNKRYSILCNQLERCMICGRGHAEKHEVFFGSYREASKHYGLVLPLCFEHHRGDNGPHKCRSVDKKYKQVAQCAWEQRYGTRQDFIREFGKSYL